MTASNHFQDGESFGAGVLLIRGRSVILQQRSATESEPLTWSTFGGMGDPGETPLKAARRELREEGGVELALTDLALLDVIHYEDEDFKFYVFMADAPAGDIVLSDESHTFGEFALSCEKDKLWADLPEPLHTGMAMMIAKQHVVDAVFEKMQSAA